MKSLKVKTTSGRYRDALPNEVLELASIYAARKIPHDLKAITSPADSGEYLERAYLGLEREKFGVLFLDNRHRVIAFEFLFDGTIDGTGVYPREVVKRALELNAAAVILSHNHPSGVTEPSQADERITRRLKGALELIDCRVLDHLIVGNGGHLSMASRGLL